MTNPAQDVPLTLAEYLAFERRASDRHEFVDGQVYAMAGARYAHNRVVANVVRLLGNALSGGPCVTLPSDMKVRTPSSRVYYPDASVVCGRPSFHDDEEDVLLNPCIIVEVLSDSTERIDRGEKLSANTALPSLTDYVLVASKRARVEHFARSRDWRALAVGPGDRLLLETRAIELSVDALYELVF
ncbi:MAG TPA: Uma2 family endonuclease [Polyangiaceae bacterium]|nr:Uma2 family endonuclease [Polyangiaceae bacterium]